jgi:hypothetical protein
MNIDHARGLIEAYGAFVKKISESYDIRCVHRDGSPVEKQGRKTTLIGQLLKDISHSPEDYWSALESLMIVPGLKEIYFRVKEYEKISFEGAVGSVEIIASLGGARVELCPYTRTGVLIIFPDPAKGIMEEEKYSLKFFLESKDLLNFEIFQHTDPTMRAKQAKQKVRII